MKTSYKSRTHWIIAIGLTVMMSVTSVHGQVSDRTPLTVDEAIRIGLKNNFDIQISRNSARIARNNRGKGTAGLLPSLDASGGYNYTDSKVESTSPNSLGDNVVTDMNGRLSLTWTLFDGFGMFADRSRYNALARQGEYQARYAIEQSVVAIARAYYDLVQQEQLLDVARRSRDISQNRLEVAQTRHDVGGASSTDLLQARVGYNTDQSNLLQQELSLITARKNLNVLLGRDASEPVTVEREFAVLPLEWGLNDLQTMALEQNSGLLAAFHDKQAADNAVALNRSPFLPRLNLNASYGYTDRTTELPGADDIDQETTAAAIGLSLSMNIFNGFADRINWQNARIEATNKSLAYRDVRNRLNGDVRENFETFVKQLSLVELEDENVAAARQSLQLQQDRYELGATTSLDFRDAQVSLTRAETSAIVARYQARITRLTIEQLIGKISVL